MDAAGNLGSAGVEPAGREHRQGSGHLHDLVESHRLLARVGQAHVTGAVLQGGHPGRGVQAQVGAEGSGRRGGRR